MMRLGALFIAVCMALIAGSVGAILYLSAGFSGVEASVVGVAVLTALAIYNSATGRSRDRSDVDDRIADLSRGTADLARQVGEIGRRLEAAESATAAAVDKAVAAAGPIAAEMVTLGSLVTQLAESVAAHETELARLASAPPPPAAAVAPAAAPLARGEPESVDSATIADIAELGEPEPERLGGRFRGLDRAQVLALIGGAIEANRMDLYLQPVVTLPQRKVRFYEAMTRLRTDDGDVLSPSDFAGLAEAGGLMPRIDNVMLFRCVQVVRRLATKNRDVGVFCTISAATLIDAEFFPQLSDFMQANRALAPSLILEFSQGSVRAMGPLEHESLAALGQLGFRFSLDRLTDLRIEPRELADRGFRFVKAPATLLLNRAGIQGVDIDPADFSDLLGRFGIDLIADGIEREGTVVDLLDYDVRFGQGLLFSPPRPVRSEALGPGEREPVRREAPPVTSPLRAQQDTAPPQQPAAAAPEPRGDRRAGMLAQLARGVVRRA
jgi:cyclic-di-GMP phosphodiesterase, flagellum assembly factor TipF